MASKIASLWKKVEDSKKQKKENGKDKRVWISKGKVQVPSDKPVADNASSRLIRSGTYEKLTEPGLQDMQLGDASTHSTQGIENKQRSRSRLSIKISSR